MSKNTIISTVANITTNYIPKANGTSITNSLLYDSGTRIGLGTNNPQRLLELFSSTADSHLRLSGNAPSVSLGEAVTGSIYQAKFGLATTSGQYASGAVAGDFVIIAQGGSTLFSNGTSTIAKFALSGAATFSSSVTATSTIAQSSGEDGSSGPVMRLTSINPNAASRNWAMINTWDNFGDLTFRVSNAKDGNALTAGATKMVILASGNVGINTSSPSLTLDVNSGTAGSTAAFNSNRIGGGGIILRNNNSDRAYIGNANWMGISGEGTSSTAIAIASAENSAIIFATNAAYSVSERMRISSTGRTTIKSGGNTNAEFALVVENNTPANLFYIRNDGLIYTGLAAQSPYNTTTGAAANAVLASDGVLARSTSSLKYKKNVMDYDKGLDIVNQIRAVYYESINKKEDGIQYAGLIAEEIHNLGLTEFVQYANDGTPDAISYQNMIALAFKAIQELNAKIEELRKV